MPPREPSPALRRYAKIVAGSTWLLLLAGGMVTSTGSGLAVPDWPLSFGQVMPEMRGGVLYEHGHRMIASFVGLLIVAQAIALQRSAVPARLQRIGWLAVGLVVLQGLLGGLTVLLRLPDLVSIAHAGLAEIVFALVVIVALATSKAWARMSALEPRADARMLSTVRLATAAAVLVWLQILLGAWVRHAGAGLAIPTFPLAYGRLVPPLESLPVILHFAHRVGGIAVAAAILWLAGRIVRDHGAEPWLVRPAALMAGIVPVQIALGAWTVLSHKHPWVATAHLGIGALLFAAAVVTAVRVWCRVRPAPEPAAPPIRAIPVGAA